MLIITIIMLKMEKFVIFLKMLYNWSLAYNGRMDIKSKTRSLRICKRRKRIISNSLIWIYDRKIIKLDYKFIRRYFELLSC